MGNFLKFLASSCLAVFMMNACTNPSELGSDLLIQDQEDVFFTDTISLATSTVIRDSVVTYTRGGAISSFLLGNYTDPIFGNNKSDVFMQLTPLTIEFPLFEGRVIDSVIFTLALDSASSIGNFDENLQLELFEMSDSFDTAEPIFSDAVYPTFPTSIGSYDGKPSFVNTLPLYEADGDTILESNMIKIPIENDFGKFLLDSITLNDYDNEFFGFHIKTTNPSPSENLLSIFSENPATGLIVYYTNYLDTDTTSNIYRYLISGIDVRAMNLETDITGTPLDDYVSGANTSEERLYVQGLSGPDVKVDMKNILNLGPIIVNNAAIEFTVANDDGDRSSEFLPIEDLILSRLDEEDEFTNIDEFFFGQTFFGGEFESDVDVTNDVQGTYHLILSDYIQKIVDGDEEPILYLRALPKINTTRRSVLFGDGSSAFKPKLELTFTRINQ